MSARRTYEIGSSRLIIDGGSVLDVPAEAIVSSDDYRLSMGGGVSKAIRAAAGSALVLDAAKAVPREAGDVVVTTAGALPARYVFHVVTIGPKHWEAPLIIADTADIVRTATRKCLQLMQALGVRSIAFPALGTGRAGFSVEASAAAMAEVVQEVLSDSSWSMEISIMLHSPTFAFPMQHLAFYEEFARRVPLVAAQQGEWPTPTPPAAPAAVSDVLELEQQRQLLEQQLVDLRQGLADSSQQHAVRKAIAHNTDARLRAAEREHGKRQRPVSVFVSYAREDGDLRGKLYDHLGGLRGAGLIENWYDGEIVPGASWEDEIRGQLNGAEIVLLLITSAFLGSDFIRRVELATALERHRRGEARVIPVVMKRAFWQETELGGLQALPQNGMAVSSWEEEDAAYEDIARGVSRAVKAVIAGPARLEHATRRDR